MIEGALGLLEKVPDAGDECRCVELCRSKPWGCADLILQVSTTKAFMSRARGAASFSLQAMGSLETPLAGLTGLLW